MSQPTPSPEALIREVLQQLLLLAELQPAPVISVPRPWLEGWHAMLTLALRQILLRQTGGGV